MNRINDLFASIESVKSGASVKPLPSKDTSCAAKKLRSDYVCATGYVTISHATGSLRVINSADRLEQIAEIVAKDAGYTGKARKITPRKEARRANGSIKTVEKSSFCGWKSEHIAERIANLKADFVATVREDWGSGTNNARQYAAQVGMYIEDMQRALVLRGELAATDLDLINETPTHEEIQDETIIAEISPTHEIVASADPVAKTPDSDAREILDASRIRPDGWRAVRVIDCESVIYYGLNQSGKPAAIAYRGKSSKPEWSCRFRSDEHRAKNVGEFVDSVIASAARKAKAKAEKKAFRHSLVVGDILYTSWGYDQTNVNYYQVTRASGSSVWVREIGQQRSRSDGMSGDCVPVPGKFIGEESRHVVRVGDAIKVDHTYATRVEASKVGGVTFYKPSQWSAYA